MVSFKQSVKEFFLPLVNKILKFTPIRVKGKGDPNRNFSEFIAHVEGLGLHFKTVIDVGVAFGTNSLYTALPHAHFHLVEPVPAMKVELERIARRVKATIHHVAAGSVDGVMAFNVHPDTSGSSALNQVEGTAFDGDAVTVPVRRLDSIIGSDVQKPVLLKIDTQGFELEVLAGASNILKDIDLIIIECSFHEFRHGAPEILSIMKKMDELGCAPYEILEGHYRPVDNALAQVDVAFVPKDSFLRSNKGAYRV